MTGSQLLVCAALHNTSMAIGAGHDWNDERDGLGQPTPMRRPAGAGRRLRKEPEREPAVQNRTAWKRRVDNTIELYGSHLRRWRLSLQSCVCSHPHGRGSRAFGTSSRPTAIDLEGIDAY